MTSVYEVRILIATAKQQKITRNMKSLKTMQQKYDLLTESSHNAEHSPLNPPLPSPPEEEDENSPPPPLKYWQMQNV